jgi:hypothetical protein
MPDHITHRKLHKQAAIIMVPASAILGWHFGGAYVAFVAVIGYLLHPWFDQDLDQTGTTQAETDWERTVVLSPLRGWSTAYARVNGLLPAVLGFPKGHRSFWSHFPPVGAFLRLLWFWALGYLIVWIALELQGYSGGAPWFWQPEFLGLYIGLQAGDWIHSGADWITDWMKRVTKKRTVPNTGRKPRQAVSRAKATKGYSRRSGGPISEYERARLDFERSTRGNKSRTSTTRKGKR